MKKKIVAAVMTAALAFSSVACGGEDSEKPEAVVTVTASPEATTQAPDAGTFGDGQVPDEVFASFVRDNTDAFDDASDEEIVGIATAACEDLANGADAMDLFRAVRDSGIDPFDGGFILGGGVENYCPEYTDILQELDPMSPNA